MYKSHSLSIVILAIVFAVLTSLSARAATFVVNTTNDVNDGTCDATHCSLREAILAANASPGADQIHFSIGAGGHQTINVMTVELNPITDSVVIDGSTQPGYSGTPIVEIQGGFLPLGPSKGLRVWGGSVEIRHLVVNRFDQGGISLEVGGPHVVEANYVGTDYTGTQALGSQAFGIYIGSNVTAATVGGTTAASRNIASGNTNGIECRGAHADIFGNYVGTDPTGTTAVPNLRGFYLTGDCVAGGLSSSERNLVSGNSESGAFFVGPATLLGNWIGLDASGTTALPNAAYGVRVFAGSGAMIGGTLPGSGNVISGNGGMEIYTGYQGVASTIQGNLIGLDPTGSTAISSGNEGISLGTVSNVVGGAASGAGNVISGHNNGVILSQNDNTVQGNRIGTNAAGTAAIPNDVGILISRDDNLIGGSGPGEGNLISGNNTGIAHGSQAQSGNLVQGNSFGLDAAGTGSLPNGSAFSAAANSRGTLLGGAGAGEGNTIVNSTSDAIVIANAYEMTIRGNSIHSNGGLGIDLYDGSSYGTPNANDPGDGDSGGGNDRQNYPVLSSATTGLSSIAVSGSLNSTASTTFEVDFYASSTCDSSGYGEGEQWLGSKTMTTNASGDISFTSVLPLSGIAGSVITSTATDPSGNTSEFSPCVTATGGSTWTVNTTDDNDDGTCNASHCSLREAINAANSNPGPDTISFAGLPGSPPYTIQPTSGLPAINDTSGGTAIDGWTAPGWTSNPIVVLDGSLMSSGNSFWIRSTGNLVRGLVIHSCQNVLYIDRGDGNVIEGNYLGLDADGVTARPNNSQGVSAYPGYGPINGLRIGGPTAVQRNVIAGNNYTGVQLSSVADAIVENNFIGTDATGTIALGNGTIGGGISTGGCLRTTIRNNLISGNKNTAVSIHATTTVIQGNKIGTDVTGEMAVPNAAGITCSAFSTSDLLIGGSGPGEGNVISGNQLRALSLACSDVRIFGNLIGVTASGTTALGNGQRGIEIYDATAQDIIIGKPGAGNVIGGTVKAYGIGGEGIAISNAGSGMVIQGNSIGTDAGNSIDLGNVSNGIYISNTNGVTIGGEGPGEGNAVAFNALGVGISLSTGVPVSGNSIHDNTLFGIDLGGGRPTPNDALDVDTGSNLKQNFPVLSSASILGGMVTISGVLDSAPNQTFTLEFFDGLACHSRGYGEGRTFLGAKAVSTDGSGAAPFSVSLPLSSPAGPVFTATATDASGNTSEFSACLTIPSADLAIAKAASANPLTVGGPFFYTLSVSNAGPDAATSVVVSDQLPAGVGFASASGSGWSCGETAGTVTCTTASLGVGTAPAIVINVVAPSSGGVITNSATVSATELDPDATDNAATAATTVNSGADLEITKVVTESVVNAGGPIHYTLTVTNRGPADATTIVVVDSLPAGVEFLAASGSGWICGLAGGEVTCTRALLANSTSSTIAIQVTAPAEPTTLVNTATVTGSEPDLDSSNNSASATTRVTASYDLELAKTASVASAEVGDQIVWTVAMTNHGPSTLDRPAYVSDRLPAAVEFVTVSGPAWSCAENRGVVVCQNRWQIGPGRTESFTIVTKARSAGPVTNSASALASGDPDLANNQDSATVDVTPATSDCTGQPAPLVSIPGEVTSGEPYEASWTAVDGATGYEIDEATSPTFVGAVKRVVSVTRFTTSHATTAPIGYYYRVRSVCPEGRGPYSATVRIVIVPTPPPTAPPTLSTQFGNDGAIRGTVFVPSPTASKATGRSVGYTASTDRAWLSVWPTAGSIPPEGTTLHVEADPSGRSAGTHVATVLVEFEGGSSSSAEPSDGPSIYTVPVSMNLVTPVTALPAGTPGANTLVIPAVAHVPGYNSQWVSDVRVANVGIEDREYRVRFLPSGTSLDDARETHMEIERGTTAALDDVVRQWFGLGSLGDGAGGVLEVEPVLEAEGEGAALAAATTLVSSRTYNLTPMGTLGQYVPAVPYSRFIGWGDGVPQLLNLQHLSNSSSFRTNLGLAEASGQPAEVQLRVMNASGEEVTTIPVSLGPGEHRQINDIFGTYGIEVDSARVEVSVMPGTGRVTAYAAVIDNRTGDPVLVRGADPTAVYTDRRVIPAVAHLWTGVNHWRTDVRVLNPTDAPIVAKLVFYPQGEETEEMEVERVFEPGEIEELDDILPTVFGVTQTGGALHIVTASDTALVATAKTYDLQEDGSTYGQFMPASTVADTVGLGDRALEILQVEESPRFRANVGVAEVSGSPVEVEITATVPDALAAPRMRFPLGAHGFIQISSILREMGLGYVYNGRLSVRVVGGAGRVTAYSSVVDNRTQDPTFVPAQ